MENQLQKLKEIIIDQRYMLSTREISKLFMIHISEAQQLLNKFVNKYDAKHKLLVKYALSGYKDAMDAEVRTLVVTTVDADDVENDKDAFVELTSCAIQSVQLKQEYGSEQLPKYQASIPLDTPIDKLQNLTWIVTPHIQHRDEYLSECGKKFGEKVKCTINENRDNCLSLQTSMLSSPTSVNSESTIISTSNHQSNSQPTSQPNSQSNKTVKKGLGFAKINKEEYEQQKLKLKQQKEAERTKMAKQHEEDDEMKDPFASEDDDDEDNEMDIEQSNGRSSSRSSGSLKRSKADDSDEDSPTAKKENKRQIKKSKYMRITKFDDSSSDEDEAKPKIKHDSSSTSSKKSTIASAISAAAKTLQNSPQKQPVVSNCSSCQYEDVEETYLDSDGYTVTRTVKKLVTKTNDDQSPVSTDQQQKLETKKPLIKKTENVMSEAKTTQQSKSQADSKQIASAKKVSSKAAPKKGQTAITNFFQKK